MARVTVTGFTAARMLAMEQATVISGRIQGNNLVLTTKGSDDITAGNVRGPKGERGDAGGWQDASNSVIGGIRLSGNIGGSAATPTVTGNLNATVDASQAKASTPNNSGWGGGSSSGITLTLRQMLHQIQANMYAIQRVIKKAGDTETLWSGSISQYSALATNTKTAPGFIAVIW